MKSFICLAAENQGVFENLKTHGITVTLSGLIIVFSMLVLLVVAFSVVGFLMYKMSKNNILANKTSESKSNTSSSESVVISNNDTDDENVIAAISAAVMMMYEGTGVQPVIRSIKPVNNHSRPIWATAGVLNNNRSFY